MRRNVAALGLGAIAALIAFALLGSRPEPPESRQGGYPIGLVERFEVFQREARASDDPREDPRRRDLLDRLLERQFGIDYSNARRLRAEPPLFAVPGDDNLCLLTIDESSCTPFRFVGADIAASACAGLPDGVIRVSGLVEDGVVAPRLLFSAGPSKRIDTPGNNYLSVTTRISGKRTAEAIKWPSAEEPLPIPSIRAGLDCAK